MNTRDTLLNQGDFLVSGDLLQFDQPADSQFVNIDCFSGQPDMGMASLFCNYRLKPDLPDGIYHIYKDSLLKETALFVNQQRNGKTMLYINAGDKNSYRLIKSVSTFYLKGTVLKTKTWRIPFYNHKLYGSDGTLLSINCYRWGELKHVRTLDHSKYK